MLESILREEIGSFCIVFFLFGFFLGRSSWIRGWCGWEDVRPVCVLPTIFHRAYHTRINGLHWCFQSVVQKTLTGRCRPAFWRLKLFYCLIHSANNWAPITAAFLARRDIIGNRKYKKKKNTFIHSIFDLGNGNLGTFSLLNYRFVQDILPKEPMMRHFENDCIQFKTPLSYLAFHGNDQSV